MQLTRRNALIGMGTVAAGAGVIGGTGAFTAVEANRTVSVQTAGDGSAALQFSQGSHPNVGNYVTVPSDGTFTITFGSDDGTNSSGINLNARTTFDDLVAITNNGTQAITSLELEMTGSENGSLTDTQLGNTFEFTATDGSSDVDGVSNGGDILGSDNLSTEISPGNSGNIEFGIVIDLIDGGDGNDPSGLPDDDYTLTITAGTSST